MVVWLPLILLAIPAAFIGMIWVRPMLYQVHGLLGKTIYVAPQYNVLVKLAHDYHGVWRTAVEAFTTFPCWTAIFGIFVAWLCYIAKPTLPAKLVGHFRWLYNILMKKYGFDDFNQVVFVRGTRVIANVFYKVGDVFIIDAGLVNGVARFIRWSSARLRKMQTGYLYHYALAMIIGVVALVFWQILVG